MGQLNNFDNRAYGAANPDYFNYVSSGSSSVIAAERIEKDSAGQLKKERTARIFKVIIAVLLFVVFCQVLYHLYFARNITISRIVIESDSGFTATDRQIADMAGIKGGESFFSLNTMEIERKLERIPFISNAAVEKKFPDTLTIKISGRNPLALCLIEHDGGVVPGTIDSEGVIFQLGDTVGDLNLPILTGIKVNEARIGARMPQAVSGFLKSLETLRSDSPVFFNSISEFRIIRKTNNDFEVLMYPENYSIPVRVGNKINKEMFSYVMLVLDVAEQQGMVSELEELDFRTDEVVYKVRGE